MIELLGTEELTVTRFSTDGYYNESGNWVEGVPTNLIIEANVQPFRSSDTQVVLPEGKSANDARIIYTTTKLKTVTYITEKEQADETVIDGLTYQMFFVEDWSRYGLCTDHYKVVAIRKDQSTRRL